MKDSFDFSYLKQSIYFFGDGNPNPGEVDKMLLNTIEVLQEQGLAMPFTNGFYLLGQLVAYFCPK
jgi:hypothetical protein